MDETLPFAPPALLTCIECQRPWLDSAERWRMYETDEPEPEVGLYCPICASYEFDECPVQ
jgi:hypothetical protein